MAITLDAVRRGLAIIAAVPLIAAGAMTAVAGPVRAADDTGSPLQVTIHVSLPHLPGGGHGIHILPECLACVQ